MQQVRVIDSGQQRKDSLYSGRFRISGSEPPADA
jgi:hypothetical protein